MATGPVLLCAALALAPGGCGSDGARGGAAGNGEVDVRSDRFWWIPTGEGERLPYREEVVDGDGSWHEVWGRRPDSREPPPPVDFARERVVVVAQHARHAGYGAARLGAVRREADALVVEYEARVPAPGGVHAQVYKGYQGFYAVVPREPARVAFRRKGAR